MHYSMANLDRSQPAAIRNEFMELIEADWKKGSKSTWIEIVAAPIGYVMKAPGDGTTTFERKPFAPLTGSPVKLLSRDSVEKLICYSAPKGEKPGDYQFGNLLGVIDETIPFTVNIEKLIHFHVGIFAFTGSGKSNLTATVQRQATAARRRARTTEDLYSGWWGHLTELGAVPRVLVWDGEGAIGRWRGGKVELTGECQAFRGTLGAKVLVCKPGDPEAKGLIERCHDYLERSFLPGRSFTSPTDFNSQLQQWVSVVNTRQRRALGCAPTDRITADRHAMLTLPPVAPVSGRRLATRLARDHYVRLDSNDYSVHPSVIGRRIEVIADLERVRALCEGRVVADHERLWAWHQTISDPDHVAAARMLRRERVAVLRPVAEPDVEQRPLSDYDTALGLNDLDGGVA